MSTAKRDVEALVRSAMSALADTYTAIDDAPGVESALSLISRAVFDVLGDRSAHLREGALKAGEQQYFISGFFAVMPGAQAHLLIAEHGFPIEQHRLRIPIDMAHPGIVYRNQKKLILENTDEHPEFRQILKTSRMGSSLFCPLFHHKEMVAQLVLAAQARNTFQPIDLDLLTSFAVLAAAVWHRFDGDAFVRELDSN